ncbi:MAG TPA: DUF695 domain-containing protein [Planctomycetaceae bacterium]|nr:DUF695 domain-containing protein [Planctomycetaceae bacterium]
MSDHWDFYFAHVNDKPASLFVDLGIRESVPDPERPWLLWAWIYFQHPRDDGLSSSEEAETLSDIEDALNEAVENGVDGALAGRITTDGRREFYYYGPSFAGFEDAIARGMERFAGYRWEAGSQQDPDWNQYLDLLYPGPRDWQRISNRHVIEQLQSSGDPLEKERPVQHWAYFPDEATRAQFVATIQPLGFSITSQEVLEDEEHPLRYSVGCERVDHVDWDSINAVTLELFELANSLGGNYDGWGTSVEKE